MPIAAAPAYLGKDFKDASPGMRFGMYLQLWGINRRTNALLWTTHDVGYEVRGQNQQEREVKYENKVSALSDAKKLNNNDQKTMRGLLARQRQTFDVAASASASFRLDALAIAPFTTGLGNEHPLENGFAFLNPYGLPYLPGSGVKGVLRQAARELASGQWDEIHGQDYWSDETCYPLLSDDKPVLDSKNQPVVLSMLDVLFGRDTPSGESDHVRGALTFWDVIPQIASEDPKSPDKINLTVEIMTPHQGHYYQQKPFAGSASPHESGQPNPISFLTVPPQSRFVFHVQCNLAHLERLAPDLAKNSYWKTLLEGAFQHAYAWLGFGAKTAVGYGAMRENPEVRAERERQEAAAHAEAQQRAAAAHRATLSPEDLAWEEHQPVVATFRQQFETARKSAYKPGSQFDNQRSDFMKAALTWEDATSQQAAGDLLKATMTKDWGTPGNRDSKQRLRDAVARLCPECP
jgi:CRISPR-associated protein Cmr6